MVWRLSHKPIEIALLPNIDASDDADIDAMFGALRASKVQNVEIDRKVDELLGVSTIPIEAAIEQKEVVEDPKISAPTDIPEGLDLSLVESVLGALKPKSISDVAIPVTGAPKCKRKKQNPIGVSPTAVEKLREYIGRKDAIYKDNNKIKERIRYYFLHGEEVTMPRSNVTIEYTSPTAKYYRHNNWILCVEGFESRWIVKLIQYGDAKRWRAKRPLKAS
jgi:hypothetical protein